jgi:hypothetical protein
VSAFPDSEFSIVAHGGQDRLSLRALYHPSNPTGVIATRLDTVAQSGEPVRRFSGVPSPKSRIPSTSPVLSSSNGDE